MTAMTNNTEAAKLAEIQDMCRELGTKVPTTLDEASKPLGTKGEIPAELFATRTRFATPGQRAGRGVVRKISDRQLSYVTHLLNTRNYRSIMGERWFTALGATSHETLIAKVENISLRGCRTLIDALLRCPVRAHIVEAQTDAEPMASDKQMSYLTSLLAERTHNHGDVDVATLTKVEAKNLISALLESPRKPVAAPTKDEVKSVAGMWELDGQIYRMKKARSGNHFYAELLTDAETGAFEYAAGMARKVPAQGRKLTLDEAEKLSGVMGCCCVCSRTLTATVNGVGPAARFIGPICAQTF